MTLPLYKQQEDYINIIFNSLWKVKVILVTISEYYILWVLFLGIVKFCETSYKVKKTNMLFCCSPDMVTIAIFLWHLALLPAELPSWFFSITNPYSSPKQLLLLPLFYISFVNWVIYINIIVQCALLVLFHTSWEIGDT